MDVCVTELLPFDKNVCVCVCVGGGGGGGGGGGQCFVRAAQKQVAAVISAYKD